jgi:hypothetical protein
MRIVPETSHGFPAVNDRHFEVHQNYVRVLGHGQLAATLTVASCENLETTKQLKACLEHVDVVVVVFDVEHFGHDTDSIPLVTLVTSVRFDVGRPNHLTPFLGFVGDELRLRRVVAVETMHFNREHSVDYAFNNCGREKMGVLSRYEMTLERSLYKALHELQRLQAARDGQAVPPPEAVDVDISISTRDEGHQMALLGESIGVASEGIKEPVSN